MEEDLIAVVVVLYNSVPFLPALMASLPRGLGTLAYRLVLVDNASTDGSAALARRLAPDALVVETCRNGGYAAGLNAGLAAMGPHAGYLVLNPDVRLEPGCAERLAAALEEPGVGIASPRLTDGDGQLIHSQRREPTVTATLLSTFTGAGWLGRIGRLGEIVTDPVAYDRRARPDWAEGSVLMVSADCERAVGAWDESFFLYSEETEFALRARDHGFSLLYEPAAAAVHLEGGSAGNPALWPLVTRNKVRLFRRRHSLGHSLAFYAAIVLREASRAAVGRQTSRAALRLLLDPARMRRPAGPWVIEQAPAG